MFDSLAYAELYLVLATLLDRYEFQLWETTKEDMEWDDMGITHPRGKLKVLAKKRSRNSEVAAGSEV
jgi:cytochrome P450